MDKYITNFDTTSQLQSFSATTEFKTPHVSHTEDTDINHYFYDPYTSHNYVNIGGVRWATMNVGATAVTDTGLYFQWGDTSGYTASQVGSGTGKKYFGWADYKYGNGTSDPGATGLTKYNASDGMTVLRDEDNSAYAGFGGLWRIPTTEEFVALGNAVNTAWTESYQGSGVAGLVCTDKTDSSKVLFFPAAGFCKDGSRSYVGAHGLCWSSSRRSSNVQYAYYMYFRNGYVDWQGVSLRYYGYPVRPVMVLRGQFPDITVLPSAKTGLVYNGSAQILLSGGTASVPGTFTYGSGTNAGTYDATWTFTPTDVDNYNVVTGTTSATISKASRTLSWTSKPNNLEMGETGTLTATPSAGSGDGTITYTSSNTSIASINGSTITAQGNGTATITANITAGNNYLSATTSYTITCGHEYVEIGGIKWATMNIGANSVTDYGLYFQWGDTAGYTASQVGSSSTANKKPFKWADYKFGNGTSSPGSTGMTKYNASDGKTILDLSDDAATLNWGDAWRMPTKDEWVALGAAVTTAWTSSYNSSGVAGLVCTDKTDTSKVLFFPARGYCSDGRFNNIGRSGMYWSSSLFKSNLTTPFCVNFNEGGPYWDSVTNRYFGASVRGVVG